MAKEKFGFLGIKGPKEKLFGGRRPNETRKEWKARIAREADLGSKSNKENLNKKDLAKAGATKRNTEITTNQGTQRVVQTRDMALVNAVDNIEEDIVGIGTDLSEIEARLMVLETVQEEADEAFDVFGGGLGNLIGWLDPIVAGINAADVPTIPLAAQVAYFLSARAAVMNDTTFFGLGKQGTQAIAMLLRLVAYYRADVGIASLFQTDAGGIFGTTTPTATPPTAVAPVALTPVEPVLV